MNLTDVLGILEDSDSKGLHNIIVDIFYVVLEDAPMFLPHALPQLEPNILIKVDALIHSQIIIPVCVRSILLCPSQDLLHGYILGLAERPLIYSNTLCGIFEILQDSLIFIKRCYPKDDLRVVNSFIHI